MTDAYLHWFSSLGDAGLANDNPPPSPCEFQEEYPVDVLDVFGTLQSSSLIAAVFDSSPFQASSRRVVTLRKGDASLPAAFLREGLVPCSPYLPTVAITIRVLEVYRNASLRCPHLAINSFVKSLCDLHGAPFRPHFSHPLPTDY
jgi:hypothetical protein